MSAGQETGRAGQATGRAGQATSRKGVFLTLEGVDGSGKSTKAGILARALADAGHEALLLREPGGTVVSERIREILLDPQSDAMCRECELLLYEAARAQLVREVIAPALAAGTNVVCDRFYDSTFAYQGGARGMDEDLVARANALGSCGLVPTRTIVFDMEPEVSYERATRHEADRLEAEGTDLQRRVRAAYLRLAEEEPDRVRVIDSSGSLEDVCVDFFDAVRDLFPRLGDPLPYVRTRVRRHPHG